MPDQSFSEGTIKTKVTVQSQFILAGKHILDIFHLAGEVHTASVSCNYEICGCQGDRLELNSWSRLSLLGQSLLQGREPLLRLHHCLSWQDGQKRHRITPCAANLMVLQSLPGPLDLKPRPPQFFSTLGCRWAHPQLEASGRRGEAVLTMPHIS